MNLFRSLQTSITEAFSDLNPRVMAVSCFLLFIVSLFLIELPPWLLDLLLVTNILISLMVLLRGLLIDNPIRLFVFPTLLVLTTLLRLSLNVSSTKLILLHGDKGLDAAGRVIESFGLYVVKGDVMVGAIVFAIIAVVNFVVIAKGSSRVAEVSARFTLDALPGRQLAIDAELRSGNISADEAARQREMLNRESQFFGAMDGAMKWVQGDAVAGLVIGLINLCGGVGLGVSRGMEFRDALQTFGILTIGDGLVTILPSLLISVSAGVIITHVSGREKNGSGEELFLQLFADPRPPVLASCALLLLGTLGLVGLIDVPFVPFFLVATLALVLVSRMRVPGLAGGVEILGISESDPRRRLNGAATPALPGGADSRLLEQGLYSVEELSLRVDSRLLGPYLGVTSGRVDQRTASERRTEQFFQLMSQLREQTFRERGLVLPDLVIHADERLPPGTYQVQVREQLVRSGVLRGDQMMVVTSPAILAVFGVALNGGATKHPLNQRTASWVEARNPAIEALRHLGVEMFNPAQFLAVETVGAVFDVIDEVFGLNEAKALLQSLDSRHSPLISAVFDAGVMSYPEFGEVLRRLVRERVNVRDLKLILEGISEFAAINRDADDRQEWLAELHSFLRVVLARGILNDSLGPGDKLRTFILSSEIEEEFRSAVSMWDQSRSKPPLDPAFELSLRESANRFFTPVLERGMVPIVLLCPADIRPAVQDFFGRQLGNGDWIRTLAFQELNGQCKPESIGVLTVSN